MNVDVKGVFIAINKGSHIQEISKEFNVPITSIVDIDVVNGKVMIK
jgi:orotate phosphoribosyltransferase